MKKALVLAAAAFALTGCGQTIATSHLSTDSSTTLSTRNTVARSAYTVGSSVAPLYRCHILRLLDELEGNGHFSYRLDSSTDKQNHIELQLTLDPSVSSQIKDAIQTHVINPAATVGNTLDHQGTVYSRTYSVGEAFAGLARLDLEWTLKEKASQNRFLYSIEPIKNNSSFDLKLKLSGLSQDSASAVLNDIQLKVISHQGILGNTINHQGTTFKRSYHAGSALTPFLRNAILWVLKEKCDSSTNYTVASGENGDLDVRLSGISEQQSTQAFQTIQKYILDETSSISNN